MQSLNNWALGLMMNETMLTIYAVLVFVVGFFVALLARRGSGWAIRRTPYFLRLAAAYFLSSILPLAWLGTASAFRNGALWLLLAVVVLCVFGVGFIYGALSHARSVSGCGTGKRAWMGIVPIISLILLFQAPMVKQERSQKGAIFDLALIILSVFIFFISNGVTAVVDRTLDQAADQLVAGNSPDMTPTDLLNAAIQSQGLEATLELMASDSVSQRLDDITVMNGWTASGRTLRYQYTVDSDLDTLPLSIQNSLITSNCGQPEMVSIVNAGGIIEHLYQTSDGTPIGVVTVHSDVCRSQR